MQIRPNDDDSNAQAHAHARFANEIADAVEQRIIAKFAKWMLVNIGVLISSIAIGIGAYYNHESRLNSAITVDQALSEQVKALSTEHVVIRSSLHSELRDIKQEIGDINRFLRDSSHSNSQKK